MVVGFLRRTSAVLAVTVALALAPSWSVPASAEDPVVIANTVTPTITGTPRLEQTLTVEPGAWTPDDVSLSYQWLRAGTPVGTDSMTYTLVTRDVSRTMSVRVTATRPGSEPLRVTSASTSAVRHATFTNTQRPTISGTPKFRKTLKAPVGAWSRGALTFHYRWLRNDKPISGATGRTYTLGPSDVGRKIRVRVTALRSGFTTVRARSVATRTIRHLRPVRRTVTYRIITKGSISASVSTFRRLAAETYADPRGWRGMGVAFKEVQEGGDFTLVLAQASKVPTYSSGCSRTYSCRVGRHVIINQTRWQKATAVWKDKHGSLRNYRHMVINHETGHWFGRGHASCSSKGRLAPVMQQQSKGLSGCRINPWPKSGELHSSRFGY